MRNIKIPAAITAIILAFTIIFTDIADIRASAAFTPDVELYSKGVYMVNLDLGTEIVSINANERCYPASVTKVMTAVVALEHCSDLSMPVEITYDATNEFWEGDPNLADAANAGLAVGQQGITMNDCLYALLIKSACEVANVIAYNLGGGNISNFVAMMNQKAKELGCTGTNFVNPHGLWQKNHYSTPYDLYLICRYAYEKYPIIMDICNTTEYVLPANKYNPNPYTIVNYNYLIRNVSDNPYYYEYASGIKTGSYSEYWDEDGTERPGICNLASTASRNGFTYLLVTTEAPYYNENGEKLNGHFKDHIALYKWVFKNFDIVEVVSENTIISNVPVDMGENADVEGLKPSSSFATLLPLDLNVNDIEQKIYYTAEMNDNKKFVAPIEKGQVMGTVELYLNGELLATRNLIASQSIELSQFEYTMRMINSIFDKSWFKLCIGALAVLIIADVILNSVQKSRLAKLEARQKRKNNVSRHW